MKQLFGSSEYCMASKLRNHFVEFKKQKNTKEKKQRN